MDYLKEYRRWVAAIEDADLQRQLERMEGDDEQLRLSFGTHLDFGTAGMRGIIGPGTNRMNLYTVGRATQGLADYVNERYGGGAVAIAYDSRHMSRAFAERCAAVLAANDVDAYLYSELMPTPMLSFAVRDIGCKAGIMITASHNPAAYNGYKVYGSDGCQMTKEDADAVLERIERVDVLAGARAIDFSDGIEQEKIRYITKRVAERYYEEVKRQQINPGICLDYPLKVVYTPLNGTGNIPVRRVLEDIGVNHVTVVPEQELPDGDFPTAPYPNPEAPAALKLGLELSRKTQPNIFIATDPDADRAGFAARRNRDYRVLSGNEIGVLLLHYIATARRERGSMPENPVAIRSVVSTPLADRIAEDNGVEMRVVLTGFKYIGEQVLLLEQEGHPERFIFGFEESCGYLAGSYVRDKDAVLAAMLLCEMTSYFRSKNTTVIDVLKGIYERYGYYKNEVVNIAFNGADGAGRMAAIMARLRAAEIEKVGTKRVLAKSDYLGGGCLDCATGESREIALPKTDMLAYELADGCSLVVRPSGTEPKMKAYVTAVSGTNEEAEKLLASLARAVKKLLKE